MKHFFYLLAVTALLFASCTKPFKKAEGGLQYKIISDGKGSTIKAGNFFEIQFDRVYSGAGKDSVLMNSRDFANQIVTMDSAQIPPVYYKIFSESRKGDSIIVKQPTDSIMKNGKTDDFMKKGAFIIYHYKIVNVFTTREGADSAYKLQMVEARTKDSLKALQQIKKDDQIIKDYLAKNKVQAVKAPAGTYVEILNPGAGDVVDTSKVLKVLYTGRTLLGGEVFDSNTDSAFGHPQVLQVNMGAAPGTPGSVITGWTDGLSLLKKGAKAKLYIPSALAYGSQGAGGKIKPNESLLFDVEVVDVISQQQGQIEAAAQQKKAMEEMQKAQKNAPANK
jgi:FKBP-type peptidyl-prolyl cis-trans isomerase